MVRQVLDYESVTFNDVDPAVFTPPQAVGDLASKAKAPRKVGIRPGKILAKDAGHDLVAAQRPGLGGRDYDAYGCPDSGALPPGLS
jgi:hypothetical protein